MASYLHHAVIAKAKKHGITMVSTGHGIFTATDATGVKHEGEVKDASAWLDNLLKVSKPAKRAKAAKVAKPAKAKAKKTAKARDEDGEGDEEDEGDEEAVSGSIVKGKYKAKYAENEGILKGSNGDDMAEALKTFTDSDGDMNLDALRRVARDNKVEFGKYEHMKNNGQKRMIIGNILRGMIRRGVDVKVGTRTFKGEAPKA